MQCTRRGHIHISGDECRVGLAAPRFSAREINGHTARHTSAGASTGRPTPEGPLRRAARCLLAGRRAELAGWDANGQGRGGGSSAGLVALFAWGAKMGFLPTFQAATQRGADDCPFSPSPWIRACTPVTIGAVANVNTAMFATEGHGPDQGCRHDDKWTHARPCSSSSEETNSRFRQGRTIHQSKENNNSCGGFEPA